LNYLAQREVTTIVGSNIQSISPRALGEPWAGASAKGTTPS
jgi:hypothetical protein